MKFKAEPTVYKFIRYKAYNRNPVKSRKTRFAQTRLKPTDTTHWSNFQSKC